MMTLTPKQMLDEATETLLNSAGVPVEFYRENELLILPPLQLTEEAHDLLRHCLGVPEELYQGTLRIRPQGMELAQEELFSKQLRNSLMGIVRFPQPSDPPSK